MSRSIEEFLGREPGIPASPAQNPYREGQCAERDLGHAGRKEKTGNSAESLLKPKRRRKAVWVKEVLEFRESGLTAEEYATKKGIKLKTLKYWIRVLRNGSEAMPKRDSLGV
jgi:hypothetical protein